MTVTDPRKDRALRALRGLLADLREVPPASPAGRERRRPVGALLLAAVVAALLLVLPLLLSGPTPSPSGGAAPSTLPDPFPAYAHLPATVERSPAGPALMGFTHGYGVEFMDYPQAIAVGADGGTYRRLDTADDASVRSDQGDPGPMLLSPDGRSVAVGGRGNDGYLATVSLEDGSVRTWPLPDGRSTTPLAWSGDGRSVFVGLVEDDTHRYSYLDGAPPRVVYDVRRADLDAPEGTEPVRLPEVAATTGIAPLPQDGGLLVSTGDGAELRSADGMQVVATGLDLGLDLGPTAVSPDGRRVVTGGAGSVQVSTLDGGAVTSTDPLDLSVTTDRPAGAGRMAEPLGWLAADRILVSTYDTETAALRLHLWSVDVDSGAAQELLVAEPGWTGAAVGEISVAADLLDGAEVGDPGMVDRGRVLMLLRGALLVALVALVLRAVRQAGAARQAYRDA
ncbi:hypothetical protein [Serinicoccus marinus]|uniref:hypothetical protein n=1 Tax=Serinicoccus marinus TaxID=247333 RepID=UPI0003B7689C|nr:hypothetical protein [Serinicoccus marinus]